MSGEGGLIVKVSAPGKVILHGEHSVVYEKLAIAASLGLRTRVVVEETKKSTLEIDFQDLDLIKEYDIQEINSLINSESIPLIPTALKYTWKQPDKIDHDQYLQLVTKALQLDEQAYKKNQYLSLVSFFYLYFGILVANGVPLEGLKVQVKSDLSLGAGTGSSASLMVSLAGSMLRFLTAKMPDFKLGIEHIKVTDKFTQSELSLISNWAFCAEKIIHGNPSGIDNTICTFGSMVSFKKGSPPSNIKTGNDIKGLLVDTRVPKNTGVMVKKVAELKLRHPKIVGSVLDSMDEITNEAMEYFVCLGMLDSAGSVVDIEDCYRNLNELVDINQNLLRSLGVSHPALDNVVSILASRGLHGKITGAGGGGYAIALVPPTYQFNDLDTLCSELSAQGYQPLLTKLGGSGLTVDL